MNTLCSYCLQHKKYLMVYTDNGYICICCMSVCAYDDWERREKWLTPEEMRSLYPNRLKGIIC